MSKKLDDMPDLVGFTIAWTGDEVKITEQHRQQYPLAFVNVDFTVHPPEDT